MSELPPLVQSEVHKSYHGFAKNQPVKTLPPFAPKQGVVVSIPDVAAIDTGNQRITVRIDDGRTFRASWKNLAPRLGLSVGQLIEEPVIGTGHILRFQKSSPDKVVIEVLMTKGEHTGQVMALTLNLVEPTSPLDPQAVSQKESKSQPHLDRLTAFLRAEPGSDEEARLKGPKVKTKSKPADVAEEAAAKADKIAARRAANVAAIERKRETRRIGELVALGRTSGRGGRRRRRTRKRHHRSKKYVTKRRRSKLRRKTRHKRKRRRHRR